MQQMREDDAIMAKQLIEALIASREGKERNSRSAAALPTATLEEATNAAKAAGLTFDGDIRLVQPG